MLLHEETMWGELENPIYVKSAEFIGSFVNILKLLIYWTCYVRILLISDTLQATKVAELGAITMDLTLSLSWSCDGSWGISYVSSHEFMSIDLFTAQISAVFSKN